ncbi:M48 family metallopeptidase [Asticcacaulis sp. YBE204]|uniref:tetratricopeptide repeat protein n=1 Tax=Asticcacaulis sp. YBE204 TaxID=1282363 RepID=UPI0003C3D98F|nr:tetratricopeptide repeat protein [Asticcacaulis sp. YBE204]ESQ77845.1 hypothetical protein AEYBE204_17095 [Asticcacaulis sp. YBE204]
MIRLTIFCVLVFAGAAQACPLISRPDTMLFVRAERLYEATDQVALEALRPQLEAAFDRAPDPADPTCAGKLNVYGKVALALGWLRAQSGDHEGSRAIFVRGTVYTPMDMALAHEAAFSLIELERYDEALIAVDALLIRKPLDKKAKAGLFRSRGYALIGLERWDEAEKAFKASLKLEPGNMQAKYELQYIADNRNPAS